MAADCPRCGHHFERQEGYWLGAIMVNTGATMLLFFAVFVAGMVLTWPDVPWLALGILTGVLNVVFPLVFYPWSKTIWLAMDLTIHPPDRKELLAAADRLETQDSQ